MDQNGLKNQKPRGVGAGDLIRWLIPFLSLACAHAIFGSMKPIQFSSHFRVEIFMSAPGIEPEPLRPRAHTEPHHYDRLLLS